VTSDPDFKVTTFFEVEYRIWARFGWLHRPTWTYSNGDLSTVRTWCISCQRLQAWTGAYRGGRPPTACWQRQRVVQVTKPFIVLDMLDVSSVTVQHCHGRTSVCKHQIHIIFTTQYKHSTPYRQTG